MRRGLVFLDHEDPSLDAADHELLVSIHSSGKRFNASYLIERFEPGQQRSNRLDIPLEMRQDGPLVREAHPPSQVKFERPIAELLTQRRPGGRAGHLDSASRCRRSPQEALRRRELRQELSQSELVTGWVPEPAVTA